LGIEHTAFPSVLLGELGPLTLLRLLPFALVVALVGVAFVALTAALKRLLTRIAPALPLRMALGGVALVAAWRLARSDLYLGLGVPTIVRAFHDSALPPWTFAVKLLFTALTLAAGFIGGEVTPLFFIGATLGNALAAPLQLPLQLAAAVGLVAMFGSVAKTPLALTMMAVELFGAAIAPAAALVCVLSFVLTGSYGIYAQRRAPSV
jgi:H+/Cl- antiporter ClcA